MQETSQETTDGIAEEREFIVSAGERVIDTCDRTAAVEAAKRLSAAHGGRVLVRSEDNAIEMQYRDGELVLYAIHAGGRKSR